MLQPIRDGIADAPSIHAEQPPQDRKLLFKQTRFSHFRKEAIRRRSRANKIIPAATADYPLNTRGEILSGSKNGLSPSTPSIVSSAQKRNVYPL
jgi:hypothetical protein